MKKTIIIEILLLFVFTLFLYFCVVYWTNVNTYIVHHLLNKQYIESFRKILTISIFAILGLISTFAAMILIALKDFPLFQPLRDKLSAHKQARAEAKAEKAEADKQAKIEKLEAELQALKKDE